MKKLGLIVVLMAFLACGCASYQPARVSTLTHDLQAQENKVAKDGVVLMVKPIHMESELQAFFYDDLLGKYGILPIHINLCNKDYKGTLVFSTDSLNLISPSRNRVPILAVDDVMKKAKKSYWRTAGWGLAFGVFGIIPSAINVSKVNKKMQADYDTKTLKSGNLTCGSQTEGFAFFSVPQTLTNLSGWQLSLILKDRRQDKDILLDFGLEGTIVKRKTEMDKPAVPDPYADEEEEEPEPSEE